METKLNGYIDMIHYTDIKGNKLETSGLKANYKNVIESLYNRIIDAGYICSISIKIDKSIRSTEITSQYVFFAIDGETEETKSLGIRMSLNCDAFKNGTLTKEPIRINKNCEWSPKALFV